MYVRITSLRRIACCSLLVLLGCGGDGSTAPSVAPALVMFMRLTTTPLTFSADGITDTGGDGRFCLAINPVRPNVIITNTVTGKPVTNFTPSFKSGGKYTVFVTENQGGAFQFVATSLAFTPAAGNQALRFFHTLNATYDVYVTATDSPLTGETPVLRNVGPMTASSYAEFPAGLHYIRGTPVGTKTVTAIWGWRTAPAGTKTTLWIAPVPGTPVSGLIEDCTEASTRPVS